METAVALILFRRPKETAMVFERIRGARPPKLFLIADGPRPGDEEEALECERARVAVEQVDWPCDVVRDFADENLGLKRRIPSGLDGVFEDVEETIVLEDDCLPHPSFFRYCEELLDRYRDEKRVVHIAGSQLLPEPPAEASYYFSRGAAVWGWATWRRAWRLFDVELTDWQAQSRAQRKAQLRRMFEEKSERRHWGFVWDRAPEMDNWDAQWAYVALSRGLLAINPRRNLISNIGFGDAATNASEDPLGMGSRPLEGVDFPLVHPPEVRRDVAADRAASKLFRLPMKERRQRALYGLLRAGGRVLELVPEPIRPKIRHRDRVRRANSG